MKALKKWKKLYRSKKDVIIEKIFKNLEITKDREKMHEPNKKLAANFLFNFIKK